MLCSKCCSGARDKKLPTSSLNFVHVQLFLMWAVAWEPLPTCCMNVKCKASLYPQRFFSTVDHVSFSHVMITWGVITFRRHYSLSARNVQNKSAEPLCCRLCVVVMWAIADLRWDHCGQFSCFSFFLPPRGLQIHCVNLTCLTFISHLKRIGTITAFEFVFLCLNLCLSLSGRVIAAVSSSIGSLEFD